MAHTCFQIPQQLIRFVYSFSYFSLQAAGRKGMQLGQGEDLRNLFLGSVLLVGLFYFIWRTFSVSMYFRKLKLM